MSKPFIVCSEKGVKALPRALKGKEFNTWVIITTAGGWLYRLQMEYGRRHRYTVFKILIPQNNVDVFGDKVDEILSTKMKA